MIEVRVNLGVFDITLEQLIGLQEGQHFEFALTPGQYLDLYVGEEKIAEAKLITKSDSFYLEINKMSFKE